MSVFRKNWFFLYFCLWAFSLNTRAESPRIGSAYTQLRSEPLFTAPILKLAKTWGPTIPVNTEFQVEKAYGRWLYGQPKPLTKMRAKDYAPKGWIFSRQLIAPGDENSLDEKSTKKIFSAIQHTEIHKQALQLQSNTEIAKVNFLDSIVLSKKTLELFIKTDEQISTEKSKTLFHELFSKITTQSYAKEKESLGLSGPSLEFLDFEINEIEKKKQAILAKEKAKKLTPPILMGVDQNIHTKILSRSVLAEQYVHPPLTQEEVDGHSYMNVVSHRALQGCPKNIQAYWKSNPFRFFRVYKNKTESSTNQWISDRIGGGYFAISAFTIDTLTNEAELAFLLVRLLVQSAEHPAKEAAFSSKNWIKNLSESLKQQSNLLEENNNFAEMKNYDVGNEAYIDKIAIECLRDSGYSYLSAINFLTRLKKNKQDEEYKGFWRAGIGYDYRLDKLKELQSSLSQKGSPKNLVTNSKRFSRAATNWNLLP